MAEVKSLKTGAGVHLKNGVELEKAGRVADSIEEHEKAVQLDPGLVQARINLVILYGRMGNFDKAYEHYKAALKTGEAHAESALQLRRAGGREGTHPGGEEELLNRH